MSALLFVVITGVAPVDYNMIGPREPPAVVKKATPTIIMQVWGVPGCKACKQLAPVVIDLREQGYVIKYADATQYPKEAKKYGIKWGYPSLAILVDGRILMQHDGFANACAIRGMFTCAKDIAAGKYELDPTMRYTNVYGPSE